MNVGAEKPEDYGFYFAWGETKGYTSDTSDGRKFDWASYKWMTPDSTKWRGVNKYQVDDGQTDGCWYDGGGNFIGDGKSILDLADDAARANWGGQWVMPTNEEIVELLKHTTKEWMTINGINGLKLTSKRNGNSIFIPAGGYCLDIGFYGLTLYGYYYSSSVNPSNSSDARGLNFHYSKSVYAYNNGIRYRARHVRPVLRN